MLVTGDKELNRRLERLDQKVRRRITRFALRKAGAPVLAQAALNVADVSETIADAMGMQAKSFDRGAVHVLKVGPVSDPSAWRTKRVANPFTGNPGLRLHKPHKTAHLVEGGTKPHTIVVGRTKIRHPGVEPHPYLEPARKARGGLAQAIFVREAWRAIEREAKKSAKKEKRS